MFVKWMSDTGCRDIEFLNTVTTTAFYGSYFCTCTTGAGYFCPCHLEEVGGTERMQTQGLRAQVRSPEAGLTVIPSLILCGLQWIS